VRAFGKRSITAILGGLALLVACCGGPLRVTLELPNVGGGTTPVVVTDRSGLVESARAVPLPYGEDAIPEGGRMRVSNAGDDVRALRLSWRGSLCPASVAIDIRTLNAGPEITLTEGRATCATQEAALRVVDVTLNRDVPAEQVTLVDASQ
jgi:hypothetical protein